MNPSSSPSAPPSPPNPPSDEKSTKANPLLKMVKTGVSTVRKQIEKSTALVEKKVQIEVVAQDVMDFLRSFASLESETEADMKKLAKEEERQRKKAEFEAKKKEMLQKAIVHHRIIVAEPIQENLTNSSASVAPSPHVEKPSSLKELIAACSFASAAARNGVSSSSALSEINLDNLLATLIEMRKDIAEIEHDAVKLANYLDKNNLWEKVSSENSFYNWIVIQKNLKNVETSPPAKKSKAQVKFENTVVSRQYFSGKNFNSHSSSDNSSDLEK
ncbi:hypothetical protein T11_6651 [Trichinella zimbabwensis]|uniref:Uncharacterized protein n=1 Tax=Trichinella zimbabwensis TaxID=268475 RepID=A0A0V1HNM8_9BILA|nr:hypothetical protein T11_6651 [Trichinella zimbabwensis]